MVPVGANNSGRLGRQLLGSMKGRKLALIAGLVTGAWGAVACSPKTGLDTVGSGAGNGGSGNSGAGASSGNSGTGNGLFGNAGSGFGIIGDSGVVGNGSDAACAALPFSAERITVTTQVPVTTTVTEAQPVALYIMLDQSGSMGEPAATGNMSKWAVVSGGITGFVNDPASAGIDVALSVFPTPSSGGGGGFLGGLFGGGGNGCPPSDCTGSAYTTAQVPMGPLPTNAPAIIAGMPSNPGGGCTPTEPALRGAESYCEAYEAAQTSSPPEKCVVVFVTDGVPNGCSSDQATLAGVAGDAYTQSGVLTFAIGMNVAAGNEVDFGLLDAIAVAGHTNCNPPNPGNEACNIGGGSDFAASLAAIRDTVTVTTTQTVTKTVVKSSTLACKYEIPPPPTGQTFDPSKVNVDYVDHLGVKGSAYEVSTASDCALATTKAWYYDVDPSVGTPTDIILCPDSCSAIQGPIGDGGVVPGDGGTQPLVNVLLGCATQKAQIH